MCICTIPVVINLNYINIVSDSKTILSIMHGTLSACYLYVKHTILIVITTKICASKYGLEKYPINSNSKCTNEKQFP